MIYLVLHITNGEYHPIAFRNFEDALKSYNHWKEAYHTIYETIEADGTRWFTTDIPGELVILIKTELF